MRERREGGRGKGVCVCDQKISAVINVGQRAHVGGCTYVPLREGKDISEIICNNLEDKFIIEITIINIMN